MAPVFREEQKLKGGWKAFAWLGGFIPSDLVTLLFVYGAYQQIVLGEPFGNKPLGDTALVLIAVACAILSIMLAWWLVVMKLVVDVGEEGIAMGFHPLPAKHIALSEIKACEVVKNRMLGIGKHALPNETAYSMGSRHAVKLTLTNGRTVILGSERAEELAAAIQQAKEPSPKPELSAAETWTAIQEQKADVAEKQSL